MLGNIKTETVILFLLIITIVCFGMSGCEPSDPNSAGCGVPPDNNTDSDTDTDFDDDNDDMGTWSSGAAIDWDNSFGTWRGSQSTIVGCWADSDVDNQTNAWCFRDGIDWQYDVDLATGFIVDGETMHQAANGEMDSRWRTAMQIVAENWGSKRTVYIRPAHELNGDWYPWAVTPENVSEFKKAWIRYYNIIQQELVQKGYDAKVVMSYNWDTSWTNADINTIWPGDQYVDVVGVDRYDVFWNDSGEIDHYDTEAKWNAMMAQNDPYGNMGLTAWQNFSIAHNKPMAFPEWGLSDQGGYDNPFFIQKFHDWLNANAGTDPGKVLYDIYFNIGNPYDGIQLEPTTTSPDSAALYKTLKWGTL